MRLYALLLTLAVISVFAAACDTGSSTETQTEDSTSSAHVDAHASDGSKDASSTPSDTSTPPTGGEIDHCQGTWFETIAENVDIADIRQSYTSTQWYSSLIEVAKRAYPAWGETFVSATSEAERNRRGWYDGVTETLDEVGLLGILNTAVHEGCHGYTYGLTEKGGSDTYRLQIGPHEAHEVTIPRMLGGKPWPTRGSITALMPENLKTNAFYTLYFTDSEMPGMKDHDIEGLIDEYSCYLHGDVASIALGLRDNGLIDVVSWQLFAILYLRQMKLSDPAQFNALKAERHLVGMFLTLHDRASFIHTVGASRGLEETQGTASLKAELASADNTAMVAELRDAYCK